MCKKVNEMFNKFNGSFLKNCPDPLGKLVKLTIQKWPNFDSKIVKYFCRMKFFARIRRINIELKLKKSTNVTKF